MQNTKLDPIRKYHHNTFKWKIFNLPPNTLPFQNWRVSKMRLMTI